MCKGCLARAWGKDRAEIDDWLHMQRERPGAGAKAQSRKAQGIECPQQGQPGSSSEEVGEELEELEQPPRPAPAERGEAEVGETQGGRHTAGEPGRVARPERATGHRARDRSRDHGRSRGGESSRGGEGREGSRREDTRGSRAGHRSGVRADSGARSRHGDETERREREHRTAPSPRRHGAQGYEEARASRRGTTRTNWPREDLREDRERDDRHRRRSEEGEPWRPRKRGR